MKPLRVDWNTRASTIGIVCLVCTQNFDKFLCTNSQKFVSIILFLAAVFGLYYSTHIWSPSISDICFLLPTRLPMKHINCRIENKQFSHGNHKWFCSAVFWLACLLFCVHSVRTRTSCRLYCIVLYYVEYFHGVIAVCVTE